MIDLPKEEIVERYRSGESIDSIAEDYPCSRTTISRRFDTWDVETRDAGFYTRVEYAQFRTTNTGHETWRCRCGSEIETIPTHRLLAISEWGIDIVKNNVVHHKNEIPWDNRIENLKVLPKEEHVRAHMEGHSHNKHWKDMERNENGKFA